MMTATERGRSSSSTRRPRRQPDEVAVAVRPVADTLAERHGLVVWDVRFRRDAGRETLTVSVDRVGGITSDEIATYSEQLSRELDRADVVPGDARYTLEVTSPGAERTLGTPEQFRVCVRRAAKVTLRDGRTIEGEIAGVTDRAVELSVDDATVRALFDDIAKAQLVVKF